MSKSSTDKGQRPTSPGPLGHGYCWKAHPVSGVHCTLPIGHQGLHQYPYVRPWIEWG